MNMTNGNAKYTELFAEYLAGGGELPAAFSQIDGFTDLFIERYLDREIGFETEELFSAKLDLRARLIIPAYIKRIAASDAAWLLVSDPERTQVHTFNSAEKRSEAQNLPLNDTDTTPSQTATAKPYTDTDTVVNSGVTQDEAIRKAEYFRNLDGTAWIILDACLKEFENLFMQVY